MRTPIKLLYKGNFVSELKNFFYEFPWANAKVKFIDEQLFNKLQNLSSLNKYSYELEDMELSDKDEEILWESKRSELGLSIEDLKFDRDESWAVVCDDGTEDKVRALSSDGQWIQWRA